MFLTHKQKKFIKTHKRDLSVEQLALELQLSPDMVKNYMQNQWPGLYKKETSVSFLKYIYDSLPIAGILSLIVLIVYGNTLQNGFISDDIPIIKESKTIGSWASIFTTPQAFMRDFFYFCIYKLAGANPVPFHLLNILFHIGCVYLLFLIVSTLINKQTAILASVLFATHPLTSESVAWISGGGYTQYSFFLLCSFWLFILFCRDAPPDFVKTSPGKPGRLYRIFSILLFLLALFSSDKAIIFPVLLFLSVTSFFKIRDHWKKLIPYFILSIIWGVVYIFHLSARIESHTLNFGNTTYINNPLLLSAVAITTYLKLFFWPAALTLYHSEFLLDTKMIAIYLMSLVGLMALIGYCFFKNKKLFFWLSWFVVSLGVTLLPLKISWIVAERYVYLGSAGLCVVVASVYNSLLKRKKYEWLFYSLFIVVVCLLIMRTFVRNGEWQTEESFWTATVKTAPSNPVVHSSLGNVYRTKGDLNHAAQEFHRSIELNPQFAEGYYNLGDVYRLANQLDKAIYYFQKSVVLNPTLWQGYQALGAAYYLKKNYAEAIINTNKAINLQKNNAELYMNIGVMYYENGDRNAARAAFEQAVNLDPTSQRAKFGFQKVSN